MIMAAWQSWVLRLRCTMTRERAHAYRRVIQTLNELGANTLGSRGQEVIRHAADSLIFSRDLLQDYAASEALQDVESLCRALVDTGRLKQTSATRIASDISQCGPPPPAGLTAA
jgi:hypothetical protein